MQKNSILIFFLALIFFSCKSSKQDLIRGKWQAIGMESPQLDQEIKDTRNFIDTVGKSTSPEDNEILYGVRNMDSLREPMRRSMDSTLAAQQQLILETWLDFYSKDEVASKFGNEPDTINWLIDEDGDLLLDEMKKKGGGSKVKMEIVKLVKDTLQLRFTESGYTSVATFLKSK